MRVVPRDSVEEVSWVTPRGEIGTRRMLEGVEGSVDNLVLQVHHSVKPFFTPRHRHNFEQVRLHLRGVEKYPQGEMGPGIVGYFPSGTYYGPHSDDGGTQFAVLQWGGHPSYVSHRELDVARDTLLREKGGSFEKGFYNWVDKEGKRHTEDGWVALWERHYGGPVTYDEPRYEHPVFINPKNYPWVPVEGQPKVWQKQLGEFNNNRTGLAVFKLEAEATYCFTGPIVGIVTKGRGEMGRKECVVETALHLDSGEQATLRASDELEVFVVRVGRDPRYVKQS